MDFITVTLRESAKTGKKIADLGKHEEYLLPVLAIKSLTHNVGEDDYTIEIIESYIPIGLGFDVNYATATLPKRFINILN